MLIETSNYQQVIKYETAKNQQANYKPGEPVTR